MMEICRPDIIHYMAPLSRHSDFLVPEMVEETVDVREDDSDEDRGTDITGGGTKSWSLKLANWLLTRSGNVLRFSAKRLSS